MVHVVVLDSEVDFAGWRREARALLHGNVAPEMVHWAVARGAAEQELFAEPPPIRTDVAAGERFSVPRGFVDLAQDVICHSDPGRFGLLYRLLWRLVRDKHLLEVASDPDVQRAEALAKAVRRDKHKMTAFVRFREVRIEDHSVWVAWFEPQHHIVEATTPFFVRRFAGMIWSILTPRVSAHWDGTDLSFTEGARKSDAPTEDALEAHWRVYYASIFNPARLNTAAMQREMPKKYWKNMPEAPLIGELVRAAVSRTDAMLENPPTPPRVTGKNREAHMRRSRATADGSEEAVHSLKDLVAQISACKRCPLWRDATQAVPGDGRRSAEVMLVGEQPGDQEDLKGEPFVGPAGKILDAALAEAELPRNVLFVTNAVKHFKFEPRGKRRLHKKPNASEIDICRWWLSHEIRLIKPKLIVALGATAATSLLQRPVKITQERGTPITLEDGTCVLITIHPSFLLRMPDATVAALERTKFVSDLKTARRIAGQLGAALDAA